MNTALAIHRLQVDWTNETVSCQCGWQGVEGGQPPERAWQDHLGQMLAEAPQGPDVCPTCHVSTGFLVPGRGTNADAFIADEL
jgi:hypothetical protein